MRVFQFCPGVFGQWPWRAGLQFPEYRFAYFFLATTEMGIPKSHGLDAYGFKKLLAGQVMLQLIRPAVGASVEFDVQRCFEAIEIKDVSANGVLPAKFVGAQTPVAQPTPEELFRPGWIAAQLAGARDFGHGRSVR